MPCSIPHTLPRGCCGIVSGHVIRLQDGANVKACKVAGISINDVLHKRSFQLHTVMYRASKRGPKAVYIYRLARLHIVGEAGEGATVPRKQAAQVLEGHVL